MLNGVLHYPLELGSGSLAAQAVRVSLRSSVFCTVRLDSAQVVLLLRCVAIENYIMQSPPTTTVLLSGLRIKPKLMGRNFEMIKGQTNGFDAVS